MLDKVYACCVTHRLFWSRKPHERHREQCVHQRLGRFRRTFCIAQFFPFEAQGKRECTQRDSRLPQRSARHFCTLDHPRYLCFNKLKAAHHSRLLRFSTRALTGGIPSPRFASACPTRHQFVARVRCPRTHLCNNQLGYRSRSMVGAAACLPQSKCSRSANVY